MKVALVSGVLIALLIVSVVALWTMWEGLGGLGISVHGYIAIALGTTFTLALGVGLMWLSFHSARRGYDDIEIRDE